MQICCKYNKVEDSMQNRTSIIVILGIFLAGCAAYRDWQYPITNNEEPTYFYVIREGWHTSLAISKNNLGDELQFLQDCFGDNQFYEIGWGDKGFYQAKKVTSSVAFNAVLAPTGSVLHVASVPKEPNQYFLNSKMIKVKISKLGHSRLNMFIRDSFKKNTKGEPIILGDGLYGKSLFFDGNGNYYAFHTCNTWVASALKDSGMPIRTFMALTAGGVMRQTRRVLSNSKQ